MTTLRAQYWPQTSEGRILCVLLTVYAFASFGFIAATIASYFIDQGQQTAPPTEVVPKEIAGPRTEVAALRTQFIAWTHQVQQLVQRRKEQNHGG